MEIVYIRKSINRGIPFGFLNIAKLLLTAALIVLSVVDLIVTINNDTAPAVSFYAPVIKIATFVSEIIEKNRSIHWLIWNIHSLQALSAVLLEANRRYGLRTSGLQFLFWLLFLICGIPQLRYQINKRNERLSEDTDDSFNDYGFWSYFVFYIILLAIWILNCFADREPEQTKYPKSKQPYPEQGASFLSRLFYTWFDPLAWKGFRRPLEQKDLWDMNPEDSSKEIMPKFIAYWDRAVAKASGYNL